MDGYAVRARDTFGADEADPADLDLVGAVHAGAAPEVTVEPGTCAEISTGAVMPDGADAVVMVERTDEVGGDPDAEGGGPDRIAVRTAVAPGDHVMSAGADIAAGARALGPGTRLTPRDRPALGARRRRGAGRGETAGRDRLDRRRAGSPRRGAIPRARIYDVNSTTIAAGVEEAGASPFSTRTPATTTRRWSGCSGGRPTSATSYSRPDRPRRARST